MKTCKECRESLPLDSFASFKAGNGQTYLRGVCKPCRSEQSKKGMNRWRAQKDPIEESVRISCYVLKLDFDTVWAYYQSHNGECEVCREQPTKKRLVLDHDHETGAFRGLLCSECNLALGLLKDSRFRAMGIISYLDSRV